MTKWAGDGLDQEAQKPMGRCRVLERRGREVMGKDQLHGRDAFGLLLRHQRTAALGHRNWVLAPACLRVGQGSETASSTRQAPGPAPLHSHPSNKELACDGE